MDNTETLHNQKMVVAETVGFRIEADLCTSVPIILGFAVVDNIKCFHHKKMDAAEKLDFRSEAHLFKFEPMILGFACHDEH